MQPKQIMRMIVDILMTVVLLLLIGYSLVGEMIHEWLGIGMFVLFVGWFALIRYPFLQPCSFRFAFRRRAVRPPH